MVGLTTAVRAQREGADVVLLEKSSERGGTMSHSEGAVWTYESFEDLRNDAPHGDPELQRTVFDTLLQVYEFYDSIGAPLGAADEGERRTRRIAPVAFTNFMVGQLESAGGTLLMETPMLRLLTKQLMPPNPPTRSYLELGRESSMLSSPSFSSWCRSEPPGPKQENGFLNHPERVS